MAKLLVLLSTLILFSDEGNSQDFDVPTVINADYPDLPVSFDPLNAGNIPNMYAMLSLYTTPLLADHIGQYYSLILEKFRYFDQTKILQFCLKKNKFFSDGSPITLEDLATSITRVAKHLPSLSEIQEIEGLSEWLKLKHPLETYPKGFTLDAPSNCLSIKYTHSQSNPFSLFVFPHYSVIPRSAIDLKTGTLKTPLPPFSGPYSLQSINEKGFILERREGVGSLNNPKLLRVFVVQPDDIGPYLKMKNKNMVIMVRKDTLSKENKDLLEKDFRGNTPSETNIESILFNTAKGHMFEDKRFRQFMAEEFRKSCEELDIKPSGSLFTIIQPGYLPLKKLRALIPPFSKEEIQHYINKIKEKPPATAFSGASSFFKKIYLKTMDRLGINQIPIKKVSRLELIQLFIDGKLDMRFGALIAEGLNFSDGVRFAFSPKYYPYFHYIHINQKIQNALKKLRNDDVFNPDYKQAQEFNEVLFEDATFAVYYNYGSERYVLKESSLSSYGQFFRKDLHFFFNRDYK